MKKLYEILFEDKIASAVEYTQDDESHIVKADKEIILCGKTPSLQVGRFMAKTHGTPVLGPMVFISQDFQTPCPTSI